MALNSAKWGRKSEKKGKEKNLKLVATCLRRDSHERDCCSQVQSRPEHGCRQGLKAMGLCRCDCYTAPVVCKTIP